jgi:hypothetical protein
MRVMKAECQEIRRNQEKLYQRRRRRRKRRKKLDERKIHIDGLCATQKLQEQDPESSIINFKVFPKWQ